MRLERDQTRKERMASGCNDSRPGRDLSIITGYNLLKSDYFYSLSYLRMSCGSHTAGDADLGFPTVFTRTSLLLKFFWVGQTETT